MESVSKNEKDRRILHCLVCQKPQEVLSTHLTRVCMKKSSPEDRSAELQKAKDSTKAWTRQGRNWDYLRLCKLIPDRASRWALLREFQDRDFFISNAPAAEDKSVASTSSAATTGTSAATEVSVVVSETVEAETVSEDESPRGASQDPTWQPSPVPLKSVRCNMQDLGLHKKFPAVTPMLQMFKQYLIKDCSYPNCQQDVDNVSRMIRYIQPTGDDVELDFCVKTTETNDFLLTLRTAQLQPATVITYINSMLRFVTWLQREHRLDQELMFKLKNYESYLKSSRKPVAKAHTKAAHAKRDKQLLEGQKTVKECQRVLREAKKDILGIFANLQGGKFVSTENKTLFRYYCEAILILGHYQRPGVVEGMTVSDWLEKTPCDGRVCILTIALTEEEAAVLDTYYWNVRGCIVRDKGYDNGIFFLSSKGHRINSATSDLARFHAHYNLPNITSQETRRAMEKAAAHLSWEQKAGVARYLAHSNPVVYAYDRMRKPIVALASANILSDSAGSSSEDAKESTLRAGRKRDREDSKGKTADFAEFLEKFPVKLVGQPPSKKTRVDAGFPDRTFYDRWRAAQFSKREDFLLSKCYKQQPSEAKVMRMIQAEGWTANHPSPQDVVAKWRPQKKVNIETDKDMNKIQD